MSGDRAARNTQPSPPHIERASVNEIMPPEITGQILALCDDLGAMAPLYLDVSPAPEARTGWCSANVLERCREKGGEPLYGWLLWEASGLYLNAEFHCVWRDGQDLHDITPTQEGETSVLFAPDPRYAADFDFKRRPNNRRFRSYGWGRTGAARPGEAWRGERPGARIQKAEGGEEERYASPDDPVLASARSAGDADRRIPLRRGADGWDVDRDRARYGVPGSEFGRGVSPPRVRDQPHEEGNDASGRSRDDGTFAVTDISRARLLHH